MLAALYLRLALAEGAYVHVYQRSLQGLPTNVSALERTLTLHR